MRRFTVSLAGIAVEIQCTHEDTYDMCVPYLCDRPGQFAVSVSQEDIAFEREKSRREAALEGLIWEDFSDGYLETLAVYRKVAVGMLDYDTFLMHGSAVCAHGEGYLFTASSGVGKTTHTRLWLDHIPGAYVVNGDKPLICLRDGQALVCGTPWAGKEAMNTNGLVPLRAICLLERGKENRIQRIGFQEVYPLLIQQTYRPAQAEPLRKTLELLKTLRERVGLYRLQCNMDPEAAWTAYRGMKEQ